MRRLWLVLGLVARLVTPQHLQTTLHWSNTTLVAASGARDAVHAVLASAMSLEPADLQVRSLSTVASSDVAMVLWLPYSRPTMAALQRRFQMAVAGHIVQILTTDYIESDAPSGPCFSAASVVPLDLFLSNSAWPTFQADVEAYVRAPVALVDVTSDSFTLCAWTSPEAAATTLAEYLSSQTTGLTAAAARPTPSNISVESAPPTPTEHDCQGSFCAVLHWSIPSALVLTAPTELAASTTLTRASTTHVRDGDLWLVSTSNDGATLGFRCVLASASGPIDLTWAAERPSSDDGSASSVLTPLILPDNWSAHLASKWHDTHVFMTIALSPPTDEDATCIELDACLAALVDWPLLTADLRAMDPNSRADLSYMFASCDAASWHQWYLANALSIGVSVAFLLTPAQQSLDIVQAPGTLSVHCNGTFSEISYATAESLGRDVAAAIATCIRGDVTTTDAFTLTYPSAYLGPTLWLTSDAVVVHSTPASLVAVALPS
ncbi:hypothetical protein SDRG_09360 [Saprolegnia diclina VS20]|uniref:Ig-like domain-containing protein n=1 Tax=Saprolegnia diclina (strain VS20) TaxID=1156394 RepID=T0RRQ4_SAPDV|nr:hypothetical protein SDRG_09360 [Saprolegnia diclina VS20]EQC32822.1 hypothetical protein SDRG_09360 [Saprolegnia diclina VS20]|eukprot:XP_008613508.1 hypothetical protein SDRG_09360 [Saprolegnia diclina VS20]